MFVFVFFFVKTSQHCFFLLPLLWAAAPLASPLSRRDAGPSRNCQVRECRGAQCEGGSMFWQRPGETPAPKRRGVGFGQRLSGHRRWPRTRFERVDLLQCVTFGDTDGENRRQPLQLFSAPAQILPFRLQPPQPTAAATPRWPRPPAGGTATNRSPRAPPSSRLLHPHPRRRRPTTPTPRRASTASKPASSPCGSRTRTAPPRKRPPKRC